MTADGEDDGEYVPDPEARYGDLMELYAGLRFRRPSGARLKAPSWDSYIADRIDIAWPRRHRSREFRKLPAPVRAFLIIQNVQETISNGGIEGFLATHPMPGMRYGECVREFRLIGASTCAAGLESVFKVFPGGMPPWRTALRLPLLERLPAKHRKMFKRVEPHFWNNADANYRKAASRLIHAGHLLRPVKVKRDPRAFDFHSRPL